MLSKRIPVVFNFLKEEQKSIENKEAIKVLSLEKTYITTLDAPRLPFLVKIGGNVDRIELRNGKLRIIDYKTGKVEQKNLDLTSWKGLTDDIKNDKIIQLLCYVLMVESEFPNHQIEPGIISFKNMKAGFMPFQIKEGREVISDTIDDSIKKDFKTELIQLINTILDAAIPFKEAL